MWKLVKVLFITSIALVAIGAGVFYFGSKVVADKVMDQVTIQLENNGQLEAIQKEIQDNPEVQAFIAEGANVNADNLPFQTKDQAVRAVVKKFSVSELNEIQSKVQRGLSAAEQQELLQRFDQKLTDEEILALKVLAYKELMNQ